MPLGVFKAALLGSGAGAKKYWFSALNCGASDSSTTWGGGLAIDTNDEDKVYWVRYVQVLQRRVLQLL